MENSERAPQYANATPLRRGTGAQIPVRLPCDNIAPQHAALAARFCLT